MTDMSENRMASLEQSQAQESVSCSSSRCPTAAIRSRQRNVFHLLAQREVSVWTKQVKKHWTECLSCDARHDLYSWVESQSLRRWSAKYCPLVPMPISTIAAAFSPNGRTFASTHGDHTVKIIDYQTGECLKELLGHRRTPWVVRYHPLYSDIVASGSLDHEVRLWDAKTSRCTGAHEFYKPITSIAFHPNGELLAVASGHKLFIWDYRKSGENSRVVLRTRRSLRAVHFHPHGAPYLLTAEVNSLDFGDSTLTLATSSGHSNCRPAVIVANGSLMRCRHLESMLSSPCLLWPEHPRDDEIICPLCKDQAIFSANLQPTLSLAQNSPSESDAENQEVSQMVTLMDVSLGESSVGNDHDLVLAPLYAGTELNTVRVQSDVRVHIGNAASYDRSNIPNQVIALQSRSDGLSSTPMEPFTASRGLPYLHNSEHVGASSSVPTSAGSQHYTSLRHLAASVPGIERLFLGPQTDEPGVHGVSLSVGSDVPTSLFDGSGGELPCTVELKIWPYNIKNPYDTLHPEACHLTISHAVLCSEMGTHFSPCGRFLVACVACLLPQTGDHGTQLPTQYDSTVAGTSPTHHPLSSHQVIYELRVYSLEATTFGTVLASRAVRAAHCLTSIQFSPTSEHILLAYGRRHDSLLRTIFLNGRIRLPVYTVLEVYRVSDMELVGVLPSALDEVNVACFHPSPGAGLVYGTKEGKLRILQHNGANLGPNFFAEQTMLERHVP